ncbi:MAG: hypothetical protein JXR83_10530 [Deltaproteobacteria bacterium]|nr:hypothetical protein [Deltaproteobacteria bacterium]
MRKCCCVPLGLLIAVGCISVPPPEDPPTSARKATATVDSSGRIIAGGNLVISIPAGAIAEGERVTVTIDAIRGAPALHLSEAYLVEPAGRTFLLPVKITYKFQESDVADVSDRGALFVGVAVGNDWQPLAAQDSSVALQLSGEVTHFSTFGLIDPNAPLDAGVVADAGGSDRARPDAAPLDRPAADTHRSDSSSPSSEIQVRLTWAGASSDFDLHLLRVDAAEFTNDDCYYSNCKANPLLPGIPTLDWPPAGEVGDPLMDIDDIDGSGPENITLAQPANETYVVGVHLYDLHQDTLPISYTVQVFWRGSSILDLTRSATRCDDYVDLADIEVSGYGNNVSATQRSDAPAPAGRGNCVFTDQ